MCSMLQVKFVVIILMMNPFMVSKMHFINTTLDTDEAEYDAPYYESIYNAAVGSRDAIGWPSRKGGFIQRGCPVSAGPTAGRLSSR